MNTMAISQRLRAKLLVALSQHDWDSVDELIGEAADELGSDKEAMHYFRSQVLPQAALGTRDAFWRQAMTPEQYEEFIGNMVDAVSLRLESKEFVLGTDYSIGPGRVYLTDLAMAALVGFYTPAQMASLSIVLTCPDVS